MKYCIVNAYGRTNRGDSVLLDECIQEIKSYDQEAEISCVLFSGIEEARKVYPDVKWSYRIGNSNGKGKISRLRSILYLLIAYLATFRVLHVVRWLLPHSQREALESIMGSDFVVSAPGGYIHDTNFAYYIALFHIYLGCVLGKEVYLAPQSYGPIRSTFGRNAAAFVLSKCKAVCTREGYSHMFLRDELNLPEVVLYRCGDSAFYNNVDLEELCEIDDYFKNILESPEGVLGVTVVGWNFPHRKSPIEDYNRYVKRLSIIVDNIASKFHLRVVVFNQVDGDIPTALKLKELCKSEVYVDEVSRDPENLRPLISKSRVFIGTRFHSCIFAMMANVPTTAISYLPKTEFIMKDLSMGEKSIDICDVDVDKVISIVSSDIVNLRQKKIQLADNLESYKNRFPTFFDVLAGKEPYREA